MSDTNGSRKFLTETLPAILGPGLVALVAIGIWRVAVLSNQVDSFQRDIAQIPTLSAAVASYGAQLAILTSEVQQLRALTQGLDGSLRPEGTLSAEMKALQTAITDAVRQDTATRDQLNALIQALARTGRPVVP